MKLVILSTFILFLPVIGHCEDLPVDKAAHFGISWAINHSTYTVCNQVTKKKTGCLVFSALSTAAIGVAKEVLDGDKNTRGEHARDLTADGLGILTSSIVIKINF